jgi:glycosyltransferase involved in cell wall biosynthesis
VLPSFNEGFGLPVVEAMASGLPVAVSDRGSLPEVCGEAGLLFDPTDEAALADALRRLLEQPELAAALGRKGLVRAERFSWRASAERMVTLLREVAG